MFSSRLAMNTHLWLLKVAQIWHFVQEKGDKRGIQQGEYHLYTLPKKIFREKKKGKRKKKEKPKEKEKKKREKGRRGGQQLGREKEKDSSQGKEGGGPL